MSRRRIRTLVVSVTLAAASVAGITGVRDLGWTATKSVVADLGWTGVHSTNAVADLGWTAPVLVPPVRH